MPVKRKNSFVCYTLPNGKMTATNADYYKTGYDRGHMVPAGDFVWNKELKDETFYYANINPQKPNLNRGIWSNLEERIRRRVVADSIDAFIVTGVIFNPEHGEHIGRTRISVPVAFFKVVYFEKIAKMYAFLFDNTIDQYFGELTDFQVSVDFLEKITGEDFFDLLNDDTEALLESRVDDFND